LRGATKRRPSRVAVDPAGQSREIKIMFPGDLKRTMAKVMQARKEGQAALEKARGETAALRNLANAARLMEGIPH
jgi:hypothetical protein